MKDSARILLVEDNEQNAYLVRFLLEQAVMAVTTAMTGTEGLRIARENSHDLILLDIQLPEIDGYQIAATLRGDSSFKLVPLIALTSFAMPGERQRAVDAGCNGYIEKPIAPLKFVEQVRSFLASNDRHPDEPRGDNPA